MQDTRQLMEKIVDHLANPVFDTKDLDASVDGLHPRSVKLDPKTGTFITRDDYDRYRLIVDAYTVYNIRKWKKSQEEIPRKRVEDPDGKSVHSSHVFNRWLSRREEDEFERGYQEYLEDCRYDDI